MFNIVDFGAVGDGSTLCSYAIQGAIDACGEAGGGKVVVPAGVYLTGTLYLRSHVNLHLEQGAVLLASTNMSDYNAPDAFPQNHANAREGSNGRHLIIGLKIEDVRLSGSGVIDGNGPRIFGELPSGQEKWGFVQRPGQMLVFCECRDVTIRDLALRDSTYWNLFIHGCENVVINNLRIGNHPATPNGDGIDIDSSRNVLVNDCIIDTGDDCITLRGNWERLKRKSPCENIRVSNCILRSTANAVRVGVGSGVIRNCVVSGLIISGRNGLCLESRYLDYHEGVEIRNIRFDNIVMDVDMPVYLSTGIGGRGTVEDIFFSNMSGRACKGACLRGEPGRVVRNINLDHCDFEFHHGAGNIQSSGEAHDPVHDIFPSRPYSWFFSHAVDVKLRNCGVRWKNTDAQWLGALRTEDCERIEVFACDFVE